jgi:rhomboid protease GluP
MFQRQTSGSVVCPSCGRLVGVGDPQCFNCGRRNPGLWGFTQLFQRLGRDLGFGSIAIGVCLVLYVISLVIDPSQIGMGGLFGLLSPSEKALGLLGWSGAVPVFDHGRWWSVLSAGWLHGGLIHIGFNMYWLHMLSPATAHIFGPGRSILIFVGSSVAGFAVTSGVLYVNVFYLGLAGPLRVVGLAGAPYTVGASAAIFGWIGALIYYGRRTGGSQLRQQLLGFVIPMFVLGLLIPGIDNWAHIGGFGGGYLLAKWLDPMKPERIDHMVAGLAALALSLLAVLASVLVGLRG